MENDPLNYDEEDDDDEYVPQMNYVCSSITIIFQSLTPEIFQILGVRF